MHQQRARGLPGGRGPHQLLGLQHHRLLRAARGLLGRGPGGRSGGAGAPSSRPWCEPCTRPGSRCILDVVFNHTAEGERPRPHAVLPRPRQPGLLPARPRRPAAATSTRPGAATPSTPATRVASQLIMDSLRYWVTEMHVDGFRFDLAAVARPPGGPLRPGARPSSTCVSQDPVVSRVKLIAEPWDVGQADSYDLGPLPAAVERVERPLPRHHARLLARPATACSAEFATRLTGSSDLYGGSRPPPDRLGQLRHRPRRLHAARPRLLRRQAQRGQRRGATATAPTTTARGTAASRARPTTPTVVALRARQSPRHARHAAALVRRADAARRRRDGPHPARQQQRLLPGQRDHLVRLGARRRGPAGVHPPARRAAPRPPRVPAPPLPVGCRRGRLWRGSPRPGPRWTRATGPTPTPAASPCYLDGDDDPDRADDGRPLLDDDFLVLVNGWWEPLDFVVPSALADRSWVVELESAPALDPGAAAPGRVGPVHTVTVGPQSVTVLRNSQATTDERGGAT